MSELHLAVWGAGAMGDRVARSAAALPGVHVTAVIDLDERRARAVAEEVDASAASSLAGACAQARVDAVYIGLPNAAHRDACLAASARDLHVLVDKPLATSVADADDVITAASGSLSFWMLGFSYRFREEWRRARAVVRSGEIGEPYFVSDDVIEAYRATPRWYWDDLAGGGTLHLQAHHVFDRWEWILGERITSLSAQTLTPPDASTDLAVTLNARLGVRMLGASAMSFGIGYDARPRVSFTVQGTLGSVEIDETRRMTVSTAAGVRTEDHSSQDWLAAELSAFADGARGDRRDQPSLVDGRRSVELAEAAIRSAASGSWVATAPAQQGGAR